MTNTKNARIAGFTFLLYIMVGIVGTAATQALVAMTGFLIAGVPGVTILTVATFFFSMVPVVGATLIWLGAAFWLYDGGQTGWAIFMILWGMFGISSVDNFVKPILISRTSSLPLLLIVVGVFGGVLVFGFIGLFLVLPLATVFTEALRDGAHPTKAVMDKLFATKEQASKWVYRCRRPPLNLLAPTRRGMAASTVEPEIAAPKRKGKQ